MKAQKQTTAQKDETSEATQSGKEDFIFVELSDELNDKINDVLALKDDEEEILESPTDSFSNDDSFEVKTDEEKGEAFQEKTNSKTIAEELSNLSLDDSKLMEEFLKREKTRRKKIIESRVKALLQDIAVKEKAYNKQKNQAEYWLKEAEKLIQIELEKYSKDKANNVIRFNESNTIEGKKILVEHFKNLIAKYELEINQQIESGIDGTFSQNFQDYIQSRNERHQKRLSSIKKYYQDYAQNKLDTSVKAIGDKIAVRKREVEQLQKEINN